MINNEAHRAAEAAEKVTKEVERGVYESEYLPRLLAQIKPTEEVLEVQKNKEAIEKLRKAIKKAIEKLGEEI